MIKRGSARASFVHGVISATAVSYHKRDQSFNRMGTRGDYQPDSTFMITDSVYLNPTMFGSIVDMLTWMAAYLRIVVNLGIFVSMPAYEGRL